MIAFLEGEIIKKYDKGCIIKCGPVGYRVFIGAEALNKLQENNEIVKIFTHHHIREDSQELYGFLRLEELQLFELLITVSGVGPKSALLLTNEIPLEMLVGAINTGQAALLQRVSGIGEKIAQKIIIELKSPIKAFLYLTSSDDKGNLSEESDVLEALKSLGYSLYQAREALKQVPREIEGVENRLSQALKVLGR